MDWPKLDDVLGGAGHVLLLHHWDTDGITSAAMLSDELEAKGVGVSLFCPTIGNFFLSAADRKAVASMEGPDMVIVVDYALPVDDMAWLAERWPTAQIDHHLLRHEGIVQVNPVVDGADPSEYPSAGWVATALLGRETSLLSVYGVIGDVGRKSEGMPVWPAIEEVLEREGLTVEQVERIVELLDSPYKVGDRAGVVAAVGAVRRAADDPDALLRNRRWARNLEAIESEMERLLSLPTSERAGLTVVEFETRFNLISALGREMSSRRGAAFCINRGYFDDRDQLYLRRADGVTVTDIIEAARDRGYSAGGKADVVGIVVPKGESERAIALVYDMSEGKGG
ncbi:MAG: hypothetical protein L0Z54_02480 [Thermoplasmata archaeon]|nr:hypothetical protein [Thermoplasmata archaeon]